jgi:hypothetical protein
MRKQFILRGINSFAYAVAISVVFDLVFMLCSKKPDFAPMVPEYAAHFESKITALLLQNVLIGITSAAFGAFSVLMDMERWSLVKQSVLYFIFTAIFWVPVSIYCWCSTKYMTAFISTSCSYVISYIVARVAQYRVSRKWVEQINDELEKRNQSE